MTEPVIIPGWPAPSQAQVKQFQRNNGLEPDGIVGPLTRAAAARPDGSEAYTHHAWYDRDEGDTQARAYAHTHVMRYPLAWGMLASGMQALLDLLSSDWSTGRYFSTQDGATFGFRRLAAGTLREFVDRNPSEFRRHLGAYWLERVRHELRDAPNNGGVCADPAVRAGMIEAARDWSIFDLQLADAAAHIRDTIAPYAWRDGRLIALAVRAGNSSPRWVANLPAGDGKAYAELVRRYTEHARGPSRIRKIERRIAAGEVWR